MAISDKTRKILWARSGNQCAICKSELVQLSGHPTEHAVISDECHIVPQSVGGARGEHRADDVDIDGYDNLILLCPNHHRLVDAQRSDYPPERLREVKRLHEEEVCRQHTASPADGGKPEVTLNDVSLLPRVTSGKHLVNIVFGAHLSQFDYDEPKSHEEADALSSFFSTLQDWADIGDDLDFGTRINIAVQLGDDMEGLEALGYRVFGMRVSLREKVMGVDDIWDTAFVHAIREGNPSIINIEAQSGEAHEPPPATT